MSIFPFMELISVTSLFSGKFKQQLNHFCILLKAWIREVIQGHGSNSWSSITFLTINYKLWKKVTIPGVLTSSIPSWPPQKPLDVGSCVSKVTWVSSVLTLPQDSNRARSQTHITCHVCHICSGGPCAEKWAHVSSTPAAFLEPCTVLMTKLQKTPREAMALSSFKSLLFRLLGISNTFKGRERNCPELLV